MQVRSQLWSQAAWTLIPDFITCFCLKLKPNQNKTAKPPLFFFFFSTQRVYLVHWPHTLLPPQRNSGSWMLTGGRSQLHPLPQDAFLEQNRAQLLARSWKVAWEGEERERDSSRPHPRRPPEGALGSGRDTDSVAGLEAVARGPGGCSLIVWAGDVR